MEAVAAVQVRGTTILLLLLLLLRRRLHYFYEYYGYSVSASTIRSTLGTLAAAVFIFIVALEDDMAGSQR